MKQAVALDVASTLGRMFGASPDRVSELARWISEQMSCEVCLADALADMLRRLERFPAPKTVLAAYLDVNQTPAHAAHIATTARQAEVGRLEAFWRKDAARECARVVGDARLGAFIAAEMWSSGTVEPTREAVAQELAEAPTWTRTRKGIPTDEQVAEMFWAARQAATVPLIDLDEATWNDRVDRLGKAMAWS